MPKLSLIICSRFPKISQELVANIDDTIGCEYELIHIDNSSGQYSIFRAYNEGADRSTGEILCFMHEDLTYHSKDWGLKVCNYLEDSQIGMIGVAGTKVLTAAGDCRFGKYFVVNVSWRISTLTEGDRYFLNIPRHPVTGVLNEVAAIDGMWFCIPRTVFQGVKFDEKNFSGFHLYDMDISVQILLSGKKIVVCDDIFIEHFSNGIFDRSFGENLERFCFKWRDVLPLERDIHLTEKQMKKYTRRIVDRLNRRIAQDTVVIGVKDKLQRGVTSFSTSERKVIERSVQVYYRVLYQNSETLAQSWRIFRDFMGRKGYSFFLRVNIFGKFIYYGILRTGHMDHRPSVAMTGLWSEGPKPRFTTATEHS